MFCDLIDYQTKNQCGSARCEQNSCPIYGPVFLVTVFGIFFNSLPIGVLNIMISLTSVMGPYGAIAGPILSIFSAILDIFGKPAEESQEGMLRRYKTIL